MNRRKKQREKDRKEKKEKKEKKPEGMQEKRGDRRPPLFAVQFNEKDWRLLLVVVRTLHVSDRMTGAWIKCIQLFRASEERVQDRVSAMAGFTSFDSSKCPRDLQLLHPACTLLVAQLSQSISVTNHNELTKLHQRIPTWETNLFFNGKEANDVWMIQHPHELDFVLFNANFARSRSGQECLSCTRVSAPLSHTNAHDTPLPHSFKNKP